MEIIVILKSDNINIGVISESGSDNCFLYLQTFNSLPFDSLCNFCLKTGHVI